MRTLALMMTGALLLSACGGAAGGDPQEAAGEVSAAFTQAARLETVVSARADYGDRVYDFKMRYAGDAQAGALTLLAPETVAGLAARVSVSGVVLEYDGARLDTGALTADGLSPAGALPALIGEWKKDGGTASWERYDDMDTLAVMTDLTERVSQRTWFDAKTLLPIRAEISEDGRTVIFCEFEDFILES